MAVILKSYFTTFSRGRKNMLFPKSCFWGKPCFCLGDTRHFHHCRRLGGGSEEQSSCFCGKNANSSLSPFSSKRPLFAGDKSTACQNTDSVTPNVFQKSLGVHKILVRKIWFYPPPPKRAPKWGKTLQINRKSAKLRLFRGGETQFYGQNDFMDIWVFLSFEDFKNRHGKYKYLVHQALGFFRPEVRARGPTYAHASQPPNEGDERNRR